MTRRRSGRTSRPLRVGRAALWLLLPAAAFLWFVWIPWPRGLQDGDPGPTALMQQRVMEAAREGAELELRQEWVPLDRISPLLVGVVLHAEDQRFHDHRGIDWLALADEVQWPRGRTISWTSREDLRALAGALRFAWTHRDQMRGRSTVTQQLAKNLYFGTDRSVLRKVREFVVARRLENRLSKERILELYLNVAEWGPGLFGAEAASLAYFGKGAGDLALEEAASLAATLPHPLTSNPARSPAQMRWRQALILEQVAGQRHVLEPTQGPR